MINPAEFAIVAAEVAGGVGALVLAAKAAISTVYVQTPPFTSKVIVGFGGDLRRATVSGGSYKHPLERVAYTVDQTLQVTDFPVEIKDKDNNFLDLPIQIHYEISDPMKSARLVDEEKRKQVMQGLAQNVVRSHYAEQDLQAVYASRNEIATAVKSELQANMSDYGITIRDVMVENPVLQPDLKSAMQSVVIAQRNLEAARSTAEANKVKIVAQAEGEQALLTAQANGERARLMAQAEGEGAIRVAQAEAEEKARLALGRGVAGEQIEIAKGFKDSISSMTSKGITAKDSMDYLMATNQAQYTKQNIEALAAGYRGMRAILFADTPNPAHLLSGTAGTAQPGAQDLIRDILKIGISLEEARRPEASPAGAHHAADLVPGSGKAA